MYTPHVTKETCMSVSVSEKGTLMFFRFPSEITPKEGCFGFLSSSPALCFSPLSFSLSLSDWHVVTQQHLSTRGVDRSTLFLRIGWLASAGFRPIQTWPSHIGIQSTGFGWFWGLGVWALGRNGGVEVVLKMDGSVSMSATESSEKINASLRLHKHG